MSAALVEVPLDEGHGQPLEGVRIFEPGAFHDERGWFMESWNRPHYEAAGIRCGFVQDNVSWSHRGVLRGMHFQRAPHEQAKLIAVLEGEIFDANVDIRADSATYGRWYGCVLSAANRRQLFVPAGFAHGFLVLSDAALVHYKCSAAYDPAAEGSIRWDDPDVGIAWPEAPTIVSAKDRAAPVLAELPAFAADR